MNNVVLDSSAILTLLLDESGQEHLTDEVLDSAVVCAVNLAEVQGKLVKRGVDPDEAWLHAISYSPRVHPFTRELSRIAGSLMQQTERFGLSLGDRCCLALAIALEAEVYTADRIWSGINIGVPIHVIR